MNFDPRRRRVLGMLALLSGCARYPKVPRDPVAEESLRRYREREAEIYAHMKRYGINRDNIADMRRHLETSPPYSNPHVKILVRDLLNPGEHYRMEVDEFIVTMQVPDAPTPSTYWLWPYTTTRNPEPAMAKLLKDLSRGGVRYPVKLANIAWYYSANLFSHRVPTGGVGIFYHMLGPDQIRNYATPEKLQELFRKHLKSRYPSREEREKAGGQYAIDTRKGFGIVSLPEPVTINGRIWIRYIADDSYKRCYYYSTFLRPDRSLRVELSLPPYDYTRDPDPSTYPEMLKKAYANMEEMASSLRVVRIDDDGAPDPFVIERVEPAPLPVREKLPAAQQK